MSIPSADTLRCGGCGTQMSASVLACPGCGRLVHGDELKQLAAQAEEAEQTGNFPAALAAWRAALDLLPAGTRQRQVIVARIEQLGRQSPVGSASTGSSPDASGGKAKAGGVVGLLSGLGLLLWKFKVVAVLALTKAKFLLLGLTKASTFLSMFLAMGVYWTAYGWKFAVGLIVSIYIHEMGHVAALHRFGFQASAPMFIPGFGAVVRLQQHPTNPVENARIGLAGPIWGLGAALTALGVALVTGLPSWLAIARVGAWLNLFNLMPFWQLDGGRGFSSLSRSERWLAVAAICAAWILTAESLLILLLVAGVVQALHTGAPEKPDRVGLIQYVVLVAALSAMCLLQVPGLEK